MRDPNDVIIGPLVKQISPPLLVDVRDGDRWYPAQLEGLEVARGGRAHVRFHLVDEGIETLGPLTAVDVEDIRVDWS